MTRLVSPVVVPRTQTIAAARPAALQGGRVLLVDAMLNQSAGWGQAILDGCEAALRERGVRTFVREARPAPKAGPAEEWAADRKGQFAAVVVTVGD